MITDEVDASLGFPVKTPLNYTHAPILNIVEENWDSGDTYTVHTPEEPYQVQVDSIASLYYIVWQNLDSSSGIKKHSK